MKCTHCGQNLRRETTGARLLVDTRTGDWWCRANPSNGGDAAPHEGAETTTGSKPGHWKVDVSFYVKGDTARDAERRVVNELNSPAIQKYIGDTVGDADVHEGDTIEWDMEG